MDIFVMRLLCYRPYEIHPPTHTGYNSILSGGNYQRDADAMHSTKHCINVNMDCYAGGPIQYITNDKQ